ncbi:hypothetical protein [Clostridium botulinum]|nr:hypothetical protein [Clostridium botulinum]
MEQIREGGLKEESNIVKHSSVASPGKTICCTLPGANAGLAFITLLPLIL